MQNRSQTGIYCKPEKWVEGSILEFSDWEGAKYRLPVNSNGPIRYVSVNVYRTGKLQPLTRGYRVRFKSFCRVEFVGDGEPSTFSKGYVISDKMSDLHDLPLAKNV